MFCSGERHDLLWPAREHEGEGDVAGYEERASRMEDVASTLHILQEVRLCI